MKRGLNKGSIISTAIAMIIFGGLIFGIFFQDILGLTRAVVTLNGSDLPDTIKPGTRIEIDVDAVVDWYEMSETKSNGVTTNEDYYCMIWLDDETFMGMKINSKEEDEINDMIDAFWDYMNYETDELPASRHYSGTIKNMTKEDKGYFNDLLEDVGREADDSSVRYIYLDTTSYDGLTKGAMAVSLVLIGLGIVLIVVANTVLKRVLR